MTFTLEIREDIDSDVHWKQQKIVAAAVWRLGVVYTMPAPARHFNIVHAMYEVGIEQDWQSTQGFVTDTGDFVRRRPAFMIAKHAGQLSGREKSGNPHSTELFSEDLW